MADVSVEGFHIIWPTYFDGKPVCCGDEILFEPRREYKTVTSIEFIPVYDYDGDGKRSSILGHDVLIRFSDVDVNPDDYLLVCVWQGEVVDKPYKRFGTLG